MLDRLLCYKEHNNASDNLLLPKKSIVRTINEWFYNKRYSDDNEEFELKRYSKPALTRYTSIPDIIEVKQILNYPYQKKPTNWFGELPNWIIPLLNDIIWIISDNIQIPSSKYFAIKLVESLIHSDKLLIIFGLNSPFKRDIYNQLQINLMNGCIPLIITLEDEVISTNSQIIHLIVPNLDKAYMKLLDYITNRNKQYLKLLIGPSLSQKTRTEIAHSSQIASKIYIMGIEITKQSQLELDEEIKNRNLNTKSSKWIKFTNIEELIDNLVCNELL